MMNSGLDASLIISGTSLDDLGVKNLYTVTLTAGENGSVSGGGSYAEGTVVTITATPDEGYKFSQWSDGDTNASRQITVNGDISLSSMFEEESTTETWYFNEYLSSYPQSILSVSFKTATATEYGEYYRSIKYDDMSDELGYRPTTSYAYVNVYQYGSEGTKGWHDTAYRTIILDEPATGDLLTFLQANATKIS